MIFCLAAAAPAPHDDDVSLTLCAPRGYVEQVLQQGVEFVETHPQLANVGLMYTWCAATAAKPPTFNSPTCRLKPHNHHYRKRSAFYPSVSCPVTSPPPRHDSPYLGGAHGLAGILLTLLQVDSELGGSLLGADADAARRVKQAVQACARVPAQSQRDHAAVPLRVVVTDIASPPPPPHQPQALVQIQNEAGNFPSSLGKERDRLVQWCHGAPGVIPLLVRAGAAALARVANDELSVQEECCCLSEC